MTSSIAGILVLGAHREAAYRGGQLANFLRPEAASPIALVDPSVLELFCVPWSGDLRGVVATLYSNSRSAALELPSQWPLPGANGIG